MKPVYEGMFVPIFYIGINTDNIMARNEKLSKIQ